MAIVGGTAVAPESGYRAGNVFEAFREDAVPDLARRAEAIRAGGAVAVQQLVHLGRRDARRADLVRARRAVGGPLAARARGAARADAR